MKALILAAAIAGGCSLSVRADILISQYYEGVSFDKYLELHNPTAGPIAMTGYMLTLWSNAGRENWKTDGAAPSQAYDLSSVTLEPGGYYLLCHVDAAAPPYASSAANVRNSSIINHNGDDSFVLYSSNTYNTANILDAVALTAANEGANKSFYRLTNDQGYSTVAGESVLTFPAVWGEKSLADVAAATPPDLWRLTGQAGATPPVLDAFTIAADVPTTAVPGVVLTFTASGAAAAEFMASEDAGFAGAAWQAYTPAPKVILSANAGAKTVYFKLRNGGGESNVLSDSIEQTNYTYPGGVVFSQYYEGATGQNKHVEIANTGAAEVDLATWVIARWFNQDAENWKFTGATATGISLVSLATINTDGAGSTKLAPAAVVVVSHSMATGPAGAALPALTSGNLAHTGNDTIALYSGAVDPANLVDVVSFTDAGNEGEDKSFVRVATGIGFSFAAGSKITDFPAVWQEVDLATADAAAAGQNEHLGTYPGGALTGYALWASGYPGIGGPNNDADGDAQVNYTEYGLGSDPTDLGSVQLPIVEAGGKTFRFTKGTQAAADPQVTYTVEGTTDLTNWSSTTDIVNGPGNAGNVVEKQYTGTSPRFSWRLRVSRTP